MASRDPVAGVERREATALFIDITDFATLSERLDPEEVRAIVRGLLDRYRAITERYGGLVNQTIGDAVFALFGIPKAIEGSARAAVNAAIEMHNDVATYSRERGIEPPLEVHTGIHTGLIVVGSGVVQEIDVTGDTVNVASRLEGLAPSGKIWIGETTWRSVRDDFETRDLGPVPVKGRRQPVHAFEVTSRRPRLHRPRPAVAPGVASEMVGRTREFDRLRERLARLPKGAGAVLRVLGEAGLGKSRMLAELARSPEARATLWLEGRSLAAGANRSYQPWADLLRSWLEVGDGDSTSQILDRLEAALSGLFDDAAAANVLPFLATLLGLRPRGAAAQRLAGLEGEALEHLILRALNQLFRELAARRPLVLCFDDLHWADVSSLDLLVALLPLAFELPIAFLLALRPEPAAARERLARALHRHPEVDEELVLDPLGSDASEALLENLFARGELPPAARRRIEERARGNPLYLGQVVRSLIDQGAVVRREGALFATASIDQAALPPTVGEVIMSRLDRLPAELRDVLQVAAIFGRVVPERLLQRIVESTSLAGALADLTAANLFAARERTGETVFEFEHPLVQETAYAALSHRRRAELHGRVAQALEETWSERDPGYHALLAYHYARAHELELAEEHLLLACDAGASSEALQFLEEALQLYLEIHPESRDPARAASLHGKLGRAYLRRGLMIEGNSHMDSALVLLGQRVPTTGLGRRLRHARAAAAVLLNLFAGRDPTRRPPAGDREREIIRLMYMGAQAQVTTDPTGFLFDCMAGMQRLNRVDPRSVEGAGGIYSAAVGALAYVGIPFGMGDRLLRRSERFVNRDDPRELFTLRVFTFIQRFLAGDWSDRYEIEPELVEENLQRGELWLVINYLPLHAKRCAHQGRFGEAAEGLERIAKIREHYSYDLARSNEHAVRMFLQLEQRTLAPALETARRYYEGFDEDLLNLFALANRARIERLLGDPSAAGGSLERAERILDRTAIVPPFHSSPYWLARLALALDEAERARAAGRAVPRALRERVRRAGRGALARARRVASERPEVLALVGRADWFAGRHRSALRRWSVALDEAERLGMRPELGRVWLDVGRHLANEGSRRSFRGGGAARCFQEAHAIFEELALAWDLERLAEARESLSG